MKKILYICMSLLTSVLVSGCMADEDWGGMTKEVKVVGGFAPQTRTMAQDYGTSVHMTWEEQDEIYLLTEQQSALKYVAQADGATTTFAPASADRRLNAQEGDIVYASYPYVYLQEDYTVEGEDESTVYMPYINSQYYSDGMGKYDFVYAKGNVTDNTCTLQFKHAFTFLKVRVQAGLLQPSADGENRRQFLVRSTEPLSYFVYSSKFSVKQERMLLDQVYKEILYIVDKPGITDDEYVDCYIAMLPQSEGAVITIEDDASRTTLFESKTLPAGGLRSGHMYSLNANGELEPTQDEHEALIAFYQAANGDQWTDHTNWCSDKPLSEWYGVEVDYENKVSGLLLYNNNLSGTLSEMLNPLYSLSNLWTLHLQGNSNITGTIPTEIKNLKNLGFLHLESDNLEGSIPEEIGELTKLYYLGLSGDYYKRTPGLSGELPESMANLVNLQSLYLDHNSFTGEVSFIAQLPKVYTVNLNANFFTGNLPEISSDELCYFEASDNQFSGSIPESHGKFAEKSTNGVYINYDIKNNNLSGSIPQALRKNQFLKYNWHQILLQNDGYGFDRVDIPAPDNRVQCYDGTTLDLAAEYAKNEYTFILRWDPGCPFSAPYPEKVATLYRKYKDKGLGVVGTTLSEYPLNDLIGFTNFLPDVPFFCESKVEGFHNRSAWLFGFNFYPLLTLVDKQGHIIAFGSASDGQNNYINIPQHRPDRDEIFDEIARLFGDSGFDPGDGEYTSTDYSRDGEVVVLQQATEGLGIDLVFMGEGFVDRDMGDGGKYEQVMKDAMEQFFAYEPYTTFRNRFNVYAVKVISPNETFLEGAQHRINEDYRVAFEYAQKASNQKQMMVAVIYNSTNAGRSYCQFWGDGTFVGFMMEGVNEVLNHEIGGHGFGRLLDEYVEWGYENLTLPQEEKEGMDFWWNTYSWGANVDWQSDPTFVKWAHFLQDSRYTGEALGLYEGAYLYGHGAYRSTENSMMRYNDSPFNAPSREHIYKHIMEMSEGSGWTYDYEEFVTYDAVNRNYITTRALNTPASLQQIAKWKKSHRPPVFMKGSWRDAMK